MRTSLVIYIICKGSCYANIYMLSYNSSSIVDNIDYDTYTSFRIIKLIKHAKAL